MLNLILKKTLVVLMQVVLATIFFSNAGFCDPAFLTRAQLPQKILDFADQIQYWPENTEGLKYLIQRYDTAGLPQSIGYRKIHKQCLLAADIGEPSNTLECRRLTQIFKTVSDLPEFQVFLNTDIKIKATPAEQFISEFSNFILDVKFKCRRPSLYRFFYWYFDGFNPSGEQCSTQPEVLVSSLSSEGLNISQEKLDFSKLYAIHYLLASRGHKQISKYGHAMLRLVFCAPERSTLGPDCLKDINYHRVVSFQAAIYDFSLDNWDGLVGNYPSLLFINSFTSILRQYNGAAEFRDIISLPLNLKSHQLKALFDIIIENHLHYEGRYFYFANNCATETFRLLQQALFLHGEMIADSVIRPDSLFKKLIEYKIARVPGSDPLAQEILDPIYDPKALRAIEVWVQAGLFFESDFGILNRQLEFLKNNSLLPLNMEIQDYIASSIDFRRGILTGLAFEKLPLNLKRASLYRMISIETSIAEKIELLVQENIINHFVQNANGGINKSQAIKLNRALSSPQNLAMANQDELKTIALSQRKIYEQLKQQDPLDLKRQKSENYVKELQQRLANVR